MDCRTHERGVGMLNTPYVKKDTIKNFFPVPNAVFDLGLHHMEINIYAYLLRIEDRRTYQCIVSYPTIARKLGISVNTVAKYVAALEEHGLIRTERTEIITKDGHKRNGCLRYTILPIKNALDLCYKRQMEKAEQSSTAGRRFRARTGNCPGHGGQAENDRLQALCGPQAQIRHRLRLRDQRPSV